MEYVILFFLAMFAGLGVIAYVRSEDRKDEEFRHQELINTINKQNKQLNK